MTTFLSRTVVLIIGALLIVSLVAIIYRTDIVLLAKSRANGSRQHYTPDSTNVCIDDTVCKYYIAPGEITPPPTPPKEQSSNNSEDMSRMRRVYSDQEKARRYANMHTGLADLHYSILPEVQCPTMVRLGNPNDGGKWVCNPWRLGSDCVVYSLGVGGIVDFETAISKYTDKKCAIHSFDPNEAYAKLFEGSEATNTFHAWKIAEQSSKDGKSVSISDTMKKLGHKTVSVFKIDIEGSEYLTLPSMMKSADEEPYFCQLLIEVHAQTNKPVEKWIGLLQTISKGGFLLFFKEINSHCGQNCVEYAYIHKQCLQRFGIEQKPLHHNFA